MLHIDVFIEASRISDSNLMVGQFRSIANIGFETAMNILFAYFDAIGKFYCL